MRLQVIPSILSGTVRAPSSKSGLHRLLICAALSSQPTRIHGFMPSGDILATMNCLSALGAALTVREDVCTVVPPDQYRNESVFPCGESGTTLRFFLPLASALCGKASFTGHGRLPYRPISELLDAMQSGGAVLSSSHLPLTMSGKLMPGRYLLPGNVSSQYISGMLSALSVTPGESAVELTSPLESGSYVEMTIDALRRFGAEIEQSNQCYLIHGQHRLTSPGDVTAEGDWSGAASYLCAGAISGPVSVSGLRRDSLQGDRSVLDILGHFGAKTEWIAADTVRVVPGELRAIRVDLRNIPDLLPSLAVTAMFAKGTTVFLNGGRLRFKESDRLRATARLIESFGGTAEEGEDSLTITGPVNPRSALLPFSGDHRIVMAEAVAAACADGPSEIPDADSADKSYPGFFRDYHELGGKAHVL